MNNQFFLKRLDLLSQGQMAPVNLFGVQYVFEWNDLAGAYLHRPVSQQAAEDLCKYLFQTKMFPVAPWCPDDKQAKLLEEADEVAAKNREISEKRREAVLAKQQADAKARAVKLEAEQKARDDKAAKEKEAARLALLESQRRELEEARNPRPPLSDAERREARQKALDRALALEEKNKAVFAATQTAAKAVEVKEAKRNQSAQADAVQAALKADADARKAVLAATAKQKKLDAAKAHAAEEEENALLEKHEKAKNRSKSK